MDPYSSPYIAHYSGFHVISHYLVITTKVSITTTIIAMTISTIMTVIIATGILITITLNPKPQPLNPKP